jgi:hypothetical protein
LKTQFLFEEVARYENLALKFKKLPSAGEFDQKTKAALLLLLEYEIRYIRGSGIVWVGDSIPVDGNDPAPYTEDSDFVLVEGPILGQGAASGPC